jgi:diadenosine tetraphosphatase ApaH/serine/threonine PP2A family protein phosphatase
MISDSDCPRSKSANDCLKYQRAVITQENKDWLTSLPILMKYGALSMVHGGWRNPLDEYLNPDEAYFSSYPQEFFASGHTHKQLTRNYGSKVYCNPGSVGQPRDNDNRAAYALFDGCEFELRRVEYDIQKVCDLMSKAGFNEYYYKRLKYGSEHFIN